MDVRKIACGTMLLGMALLMGCTAPRNDELVLIEPSYSHHRDQPALTSDDTWSAGPGPFADRPVERRLVPSTSGEPSVEAFTWPHTP